MNGKDVFGNVISFLFGMITGAAIALILAPETGSELRSQIGEKASVAGQQVRSQYERSRNWIEGEAAKMQRERPSESEN